MFGIKKMIHKWVIKRMSYELQFFIDTLKNMSPYDVSFVVMTATATRNTFIKNMTLDFGNPAAALKKSPYAILHLGKLIKDCERKKNFVSRTAYIVWLHTLRVASQPELLHLGIELWKELGRGIEYINSNPDFIEKCTSERANPAGYEIIPNFT